MTEPSMPQPVLFPDTPHWGAPPMPTASTQDSSAYTRPAPPPLRLPHPERAMPQPFAASDPQPPPMPVPHLYGAEPTAQGERRRRRRGSAGSQSSSRGSSDPPMPQPALAMPEPPPVRRSHSSRAAAGEPPDPPAREASPVTATTATAHGGTISHQPAETKPMVLSAPPVRERFSYSLLGSSTRDCETCCVACWCPCITYSQNVTRYRHLREHGVPHPTGGDDCAPDCWYHCGLMALGASGWILQMFSRSNVRSRYQIPGNTLNDCCASSFCMPCELTQESLEMDEEEKLLVEKPTIIDI